MKPHLQIALAGFFIFILNISAQSSVAKSSSAVSPVRQLPNSAAISPHNEIWMTEGECGGLHYEVHSRVENGNRFSILEISNHSGSKVARRTIMDNELLDFECGHEPVKGVKTMQFDFSSGGSGIKTDWLIYRVNPFQHLLSISLYTHSDDPAVEYRDLDGDGQKEVIVRNSHIAYALCESCGYDADNVEYLLCYAGGSYHECAKEHSDYFRALIEHGFKQLTQPREKHHRLAWSLYILFHAEEIGEGDTAWARLASVLPPDFLEKVQSRRGRIGKAIAERDRSWKTN